MQQQEVSPDVGSSEATPQMELDLVKVQEFRVQLERQQNLPAGVVAGLAAAVIGGMVWAALTITTHYQIGYMAVGVGFLVGFTVRFVGRGMTTSFAMAGCLLALVGCLLGNLLSVCGIISIQESIPLLHILSRLNPELVMQLLSATFSPIDLLFYAIALHAGYRYSVRRITPEEVQSMLKAQS